MANIGTELADILHRIIHSSAAAEVEKIALHDAVAAIAAATAPPSAPVDPPEKTLTPEVTTAKESE